jgi:hypothetical protein
LTHIEIDISPASKSEREALDAAITDFNISIAPELPRAILHRLDFSAKDSKGGFLENAGVKPC